MKINYYACLLRIRGKSRSASGEREREDAVGDLDVGGNGLDGGQGHENQSSDVSGFHPGIPPVRLRLP